MTRLINAPTRKFALACAAWNTGEDAFSLLHAAITNVDMGRDRKFSGFNKIMDQGFANFLRICEIDLGHIDKLHSARDLYRWAVNEIRSTREKVQIKQDEYKLTVHNDEYVIDIDPTTGMIYALGSARTQGHKPQYLVDAFKLIATGFQVLYTVPDYDVNDQLDEFSRKRSA